jgi:hypothetical protein
MYWILKRNLDGLRIQNSSQLPSDVHAAELLAFPYYCKVIRNSKFHCMFEATSYHPNVFTFTLFLSEGRAGLA